MPLSCTTNTGKALMAFDYDVVSWRRLVEENRRNKHLAMACCGRSVVLKTSHLGTRFFAHTRRLDSKCAVETEQHLLAKDIIAKAVVAAGWKAETEAPLREVNRIADVLATREKVRVAFEVQWSRTRDLEIRHKAYRTARIRGLWLLKHVDVWSSREVPAFRLVYAPNDRRFDVWVWDDRAYLTDKKCKPIQVVELSRFVRGALGGRLQWRPAHGIRVPAELITISTQCRTCFRAVGLVDRIRFCPGMVLPGHKDIVLSLDAFGEFPEPFRSQVVSERLLALEGVIIRRRFTPALVSRFKKVDVPHIECVCAGCNSPQYHYDLRRQEPREERVAVRFDLQLNSETLDKIPGLDSSISCWWFDERTP